MQKQLKAKVTINSSLRLHFKDLPLLRSDNFPEDNLHSLLIDHFKEHGEVNVKRSLAGFREDLLQRFLKENSN